MNAVLWTYRIVASRYRNCDQVIIWFGPCFSFRWSAGFALPWVVMASLEQFVAMAPMAARTISLS